MAWRAIAVGLAMLLAAGCVLDRAGVTEGAQGGGGDAAGAGGGGQGGEAGQGGAGGGADPVCGDGEVNQASEECDNGPQDTAGCDEDCTMVECGDGHINQPAGESCDDGNTNNGDGCSDVCVLESCGNMMLDPGEDCDDGNTNNNDDCLDNCNFPSCGDGHIHNEQSGTEQCDDNNGNNNDDCPDGVNGSCQPASCGDGFIHNEQSGTEQCDDGGANNDNGDCLLTCMTANCGDGNVHNMGSGTEQCDNAGANNNNGDCLLNCMAASCGDGFLHNQGSASETCDDGDTDSNDGCSSLCDREPGACCDGEGQGSCVVSPAPIGMGALALGIMDNSTTCETFTFSQLGCGSIADVNVTLGIDHTYVGDLFVTLEGPNMSLQTLLNFPPSGADLSAANPVIFDDEAIVGASAMGVGLADTETICMHPSSPCEYYPFPGLLSAFDSSSPVGIWEICVSDGGTNDTGTLDSVLIEITTD